MVFLKTQGQINSRKTRNNLIRSRFSRSCTVPLLWSYRNRLLLFPRKAAPPAIFDGSITDGAVREIASPNEYRLIGLLSRYFVGVKIIRNGWSILVLNFLSAFWLVAQNTFRRGWQGSWICARWTSKSWLVGTDQSTAGS
jgi:hypothetical protein